MAKKPSPKVDNTSSAYDRMAPRLMLVSSLMGGTETMRAAGETLLPRYEAESTKNWEHRRNRAVLFNAFRRTVEGLVGKPFSKPIQLGDDVPPAIEDLMEDVDRQGNHLNIFARQAFRDGLAKGLTHILVDFPQVNSENVKSLADERELGATPYWVLIPAESLIAAYAEVINGVEVLTHVRIQEDVIERSGFDEACHRRIRVLEPGIWQLWEFIDKRWTMINNGTTTLDVIPLVTFYADREDFMVGRPPLSDLANLNVAHWQSASDQRNCLTVARFPILAGAGLVEEEGEQQIGPNKYLTSQDPAAKFYYVEHTGAAINSGRQDLEDLKSEMAMLGIELLRRTGTITATEKAIDTAENTSQLQTMVLSFADCLEQALALTAAWMGLPEGGSVEVNKDFGLKLNEATDLDVLFKARAANEISHIVFMGELQRRGVVSDDYDVEDDQKLLDEEHLKDVANQVFQHGLVKDGSLPPDGKGIATEPKKVPALDPATDD